MRLDRFLCDSGIAGRRDLKKYIKSGRAQIDGKTVTEPEAKFDPEISAVTFDGQRVEYKRFHYFMMNKPAGVLSATEDRKQNTVLDLLSEQHKRFDLFPVGRLDKDTTGLLILTDDGDYAHRVISPKSGVKKRYYAVVEGTPGQEHVKAFKQGIELGDGLKCLPAELEIIGENRVIVTVEEGKFHQVKRMLAACGTPVLELKRLSTGSIILDKDLAPGEYRELTATEAEEAFRQVDKFDAEILKPILTNRILIP